MESESKPTIVRSVLLATPNYDGKISTGTHVSSLWPSDARLRVRPCDFGGSVLPMVFNHAWVAGVEGNWDLFAMIHADVSAEPGWLGKLVEILDEEQADIVSCVIPIKDDTRVVSTAWDRGDDVVHLTYEDIERLPATFGDAELLELYPESKGLMMNTGCWVARLKQPWNKQWRGFTTTSWIDWERKPPVVHVGGEDYLMSRALRALDPPPRVLATSAVQTRHEGRSWWSSPRSASLPPLSQEAASW